MSAPSNGPQPQPQGGPPPWLNPQIQPEVALRDGDIWISVPVKSGTNWMMNIVHQLLTGGDADFDSIYSVVPWPELVERPGQPRQEVLDRLAAMPAGARRVFKSHSAPPELPFFKAGQGPDVKYIAVCRNPEEALVSFKVFLENHTDAFYDLWKVPRAALTRPDFDDVLSRGGRGQGDAGHVLRLRGLVVAAAARAERAPAALRGHQARRREGPAPDLRLPRVPRRPRRSGRRSRSTPPSSG